MTGEVEQLALFSDTTPEVRVEETVAPAPEGPRLVTVLVDVVSPGKGLVTCGAGDFSGVIVRQDGRYLVETDTGDVLCHARSYRAGATRLARDHGGIATAVEVHIEREPS